MILSLYFAIFVVAVQSRTSVSFLLLPGRHTCASCGNHGREGRRRTRNDSPRAVDTDLATTSLPRAAPSREEPRVLRAIPEGRVEDMDEWIRWSSDSLERITGKSLFDRMDGVDKPSQVHDHERYAVLSHGTQDDPIYCYFNKASFLLFKWSEDEVYRLPSRYSAPNGIARTARESDIRQAVDEDLKVLPSGVRQDKFGNLFQLVNVLLWNVYDDNGERVGQTALYDRDLIRPHDEDGSESSTSD